MVWYGDLRWLAVREEHMAHVGVRFIILVTITVENDDRGCTMMIDSQVFGNRKLQPLPKNGNRESSTRG